LRIPRQGVPASERGLPADFNHDGSVDAADLVQWQLGFGAANVATHMQGDANSDGAVDGADFLIWQRQLGAGWTAAASVPESTALAMALTIAAAAFWPLRTVRRHGTVVGQFNAARALEHGVVLNSIAH
jgi:hypothetical protein